MNIKQLKFDIGEELNIRECPKLKTKSIDDLQALVSEGTTIVKCGRAYYDVSNRIDIYEHEQAEELDISSLTSIDRKDISSSPVMAAVFPEGIDERADDPMAMLFQKTDVEEKKPEDETLLPRKTYFIRNNQITAMNQLCVLEDRKISEMVRELIDIGLEAKKEEYSRDFLAEADMIQNAQKQKKSKRT